MSYSVVFQDDQLYTIVDDLKETISPVNHPCLFLKKQRAQKICDELNESVSRCYIVHPYSKYLIIDNNRNIIINCVSFFEAYEYLKTLNHNPFDGLIDLKSGVDK